MVVLDELNIVLRKDYLPLAEVIEGLRAERPELHVVVTGRNAKPELIEAADLVTEMTLVKHPFRAGVKAQLGVEYCCPARRPRSQVEGWVTRTCNPTDRQPIPAGLAFLCASTNLLSASARARGDGPHASPHVPGHRLECREVAAGDRAVSGIHALRP